MKVVILVWRYLEEVLASLAISVTVLMVVANVILRYGFGFVVPWSEELAVVCFIGAVYFGISSCYKHRMHMGVDVLVILLPERFQSPFKILSLLFLIVVNGGMAHLSYQYTMLSNKVTPVMGMSYFAINSVLVLSFGLMLLHSFIFLYQEIAKMRGQSWAGCEEKAS